MRAHRCSIIAIIRLTTKGGPIPLFSDTFDTKYRAKKSTDTDSDTDPSPHSILRDYIHIFM